jgi:hydrogenase expression/formation protein HypE
MDKKRIKLEHGSGGALTRQLIEEVIHPFFAGPDYGALDDAAVFDPGVAQSEAPGGTSCGASERTICLTTDSFVVDPPFFPGGDIGELAIFGTCNDLAVSGGLPLRLTLSLILEEGFEIDQLRRVLGSAAQAARRARVAVVSGDTKVVPSGRGGGIYVNSAGVGRCIYPHSTWGDRLEPGDVVIVSAPVGAHGVAVLAAREKLPVGTHVRSDCTFLFDLCHSLFALDRDLRFLRDATRGGLAATLNELASTAGLPIDIDEQSIPLDEDVAAAAEILGLNPLEIANEGVLVAVVAEGRAEEAVELLHNHPAGKYATIVGRVGARGPAPRVMLTTRVGGRRIVDLPRGLILPRIC